MNNNGPAAPSFQMYLNNQEQRSKLYINSNFFRRERSSTADAQHITTQLNAHIFCCKLTPYTKRQILLPISIIFVPTISTTILLQSQNDDEKK